MVRKLGRLLHILIRLQGSTQNICLGLSLFRVSNCDRNYGALFYLLKLGLFILELGLIWTISSCICIVRIGR